MTDDQWWQSNTIPTEPQLTCWSSFAAIVFNQNIKEKKTLKYKIENQKYWSNGLFNCLIDF